MQYLKFYSNILMFYIYMCDVVFMYVHVCLCFHSFNDFVVGLCTCRIYLSVFVNVFASEDVCL